MHTNVTGQIVDVWSWGSSASNPVAHADDRAFAATNLANDTGAAFTSTNLDGGVPIYMSEYGVNANSPVIYAPDSGLHPMAVPFDPAGLDAGARIPRVVHQLPSGSRADVHAVGQWRNGKWTVELSRARVTSDATDVQF